MPVGLLHRGGVRLTVTGSILKLVERPQMNVSLLISENGVLNHTNAITVRKLSIIHTHARTHTTERFCGNSCNIFVMLTF